MSRWRDLEWGYEEDEGAPFMTPEQRAILAREDWEKFAADIAGSPPPQNIAPSWPLTADNSAPARHPTESSPARWRPGMHPAAPGYGAVPATPAYKGPLVDAPPGQAAPNEGVGVLSMPPGPADAVPQRQQSLDRSMMMIPGAMDPLTMRLGSSNVTRQTTSAALSPEQAEGYKTDLEDWALGKQVANAKLGREIDGLRASNRAEDKALGKTLSELHAKRMDAEKSSAEIQERIKNFDFSPGQYYNRVVGAISLALGSLGQNIAAMGGLKIANNVPMLVQKAMDRDIAFQRMQYQKLLNESAMSDKAKSSIWQQIIRSEDKQRMAANEYTKLILQQHVIETDDADVVKALGEGMMKLDMASRDKSTVTRSHSSKEILNPVAVAARNAEMGMMMKGDAPAAPLKLSGTDRKHLAAAQENVMDLIRLWGKYVEKKPVNIPLLSKMIPDWSVYQGSANQTIGLFVKFVTGVQNRESEYSRLAYGFPRGLGLGEFTRAVAGEKMGDKMESAVSQLKHWIGTYSQEEQAQILDRLNPVVRQAVTLSMQTDSPEGLAKWMGAKYGIGPDWKKAQRVQARKNK